MENLFKRNNLQEFILTYEQSVKYILDRYGISSNITTDHLGCLLHNSKEFDNISNLLSEYSTQIKEIELHDRRVRVFKFLTPLEGIYTIPKIEIFEPKPGINLSKQRYGIEHISFRVENWDNFIDLDKKKLPIAKEGSVNTSKFLKTEIINTVEIEFRSDSLGEE